MRVKKVYKVKERALICPLERRLIHNLHAEMLIVRPEFPIIKHTPPNRPDYVHPIFMDAIQDLRQICLVIERPRQVVLLGCQRRFCLDRVIDGVAGQHERRL